MKEKLMDTRCKHYRIVIDCDSEPTRISVVIDGREIKETIARQTPEDDLEARIRNTICPERGVRA